MKRYFNKTSLFLVLFLGSSALVIAKKSASDPTPSAWQSVYDKKKEAERELNRLIASKNSSLSRVDRPYDPSIDDKIKAQQKVVDNLAAQLKEMRKASSK